MNCIGCGKRAEVFIPFPMGPLCFDCIGFEFATTAKRYGESIYHNLDRKFWTSVLCAAELMG